MAGPLLAAGIAAGASLAGTGLQIGAAGKMNKKTRNWNNQQIERQREWALQDYHMQNQYNSPAMQMKRLKEAGLNPHLVYGNGADAQGANMAPPPAAEIGRQEVPDIAGGINNAISAYQDTTTRALQNNLIKTQNEIAEKEVDLKKSQKAALDLAIVEKGLDIDFKGKINPYNIQAKQKQIETFETNMMKTLADIDLNTGRYNREKIMQESALDTATIQRQIMHMSMNKTKEEINQIRQNIENMKKSGEYQGYMNQIQKRITDQGLTTSDPSYFRMLSEFLQQVKEGKITMF